MPVNGVAEAYRCVPTGGGPGRRNSFAPNSLADYVLTWRQILMTFLKHTAPIVRETDEDVKAFRTFLVRATAQALENGLRMLGWCHWRRFKGERRGRGSRTSRPQYAST